MSTRAFVFLTSILLAGCYSTTRVRPDEVIRIEASSTSELTVVSRSGDEKHFDAPRKTSMSGAVLVVTPRTAPPELFEAAQVESVEVTTYSPARTSVLVGVTLAAVSAAALGAAVATNTIQTQPRRSSGTSGLDLIVLLALLSAR